eukprot:CAMPEP_0184656758 /NCGR_PEP_ID=MMETSP0308-20130426/16732_1 /TAXON_ID=38269 /ORGANISM="Gloeochaete witrockiana, Strain SAG 46.84" /LENGTH=236 /DNA_ID=CAMNT_0027094019 /DNA_START=14 /DNA_END=724 /DNA_ORIENTATION=+
MPTHIEARENDLGNLERLLDSLTSNALERRQESLTEAQKDVLRSELSAVSSRVFQRLRRACRVVAIDDTLEETQAAELVDAQEILSDRVQRLETDVNDLALRIQSFRDSTPEKIQRALSERASVDVDVLADEPEDGDPDLAGDVPLKEAFGNLRSAFVDTVKLSARLSASLPASAQKTASLLKILQGRSESSRNLTDVIIAGMSQTAHGSKRPLAEETNFVHELAMDLQTKRQKLT